MALNARNKGKAGESEFINRFQPFFPNELKRNLEQVRSGGSDIAGCAPFVIEIKRCEKLELTKWWGQVGRASGPGVVPVVAYRQNRGQWQFLLPTWMLGLKTNSYVIVKEEDWLQLLILVYKGDVPPWISLMLGGQN